MSAISSNINIGNVIQPTFLKKSATMSSIITSRSRRLFASARRVAGSLHDSRWQAFTEFDQAAACSFHPTCAYFGQIGAAGDRVVPDIAAALQTVPVLLAADNRER